MLITCFILLIALASGCGSSNDKSTSPIADSDAPAGDDSPVVETPADTGPVDITNVLLTATSSDCADYVNAYQSTARDINRSLDFSGMLTVSVTAAHCVFSSNAIPNHDFNDGARTFVSALSAQSSTFEVPRAPAAAASTTALSLRTDNAVFLNGVKLDLLAAGCFGVGDGKIGCFDMNSPFRFDPMSLSADFGTDSHNAHTQPDGTYHYHGNPNALFADDPAPPTQTPSPVIGFAADGFPVYGSYVRDGDTIRKARSSYAVKNGTRAARNGINPGGTFDGTFVDDYEYVAGSGDLDACNGMTVDGSYGYYVTDSYPWVLGCFRGTPDESFNKMGP